MTSRLIRLLAISILSLFSAQAVAQSCTPPGLTILEDAEGDWTGTVSSIAGVNGAGLPEQDLLGLSIAQSTSAAGDVLVHFTLKVQPFSTPGLPPTAAWFSSFETPDGVIYGVRMQTNQTGTPSFFSYVPSASNAGTIDGRFVTTGTEKPAEAGSGHDADGTITIIVKAANLGLTDPLAGQTLGPFNAATVQQAVVLGLTIDEMPDGLGRDGFYDLQSCGGKSGSGLTLGGGIGFALLLPLALIGLRRARRLS